jgi:hypothetical protein
MHHPEVLPMTALAIFLTACLVCTAPAIRRRLHRAGR